MTRPRLRRLLLYCLLPPAAFLAWLLAVWPPPVWYRTHWPAETAFMAMRGARPLPGATGPCRSTRWRRPCARPRRPARMPGSGPMEGSTIRRCATRWATGGRGSPGIRRATGRSCGGCRAAPGQRRDALRGASTITQQVAKNLYLSPSRNPLRKLKEAVTAWRLERALGKPRILELYLNIAELGDGIWGVEAASRRYFNGRPGGSPRPRPRRSPPRCRFRSGPIPATGPTACGAGRT